MHQTQEPSQDLLVRARLAYELMLGHWTRDGDYHGLTADEVNDWVAKRMLPDGYSPDSLDAERRRFTELDVMGFLVSHEYADRIRLSETYYYPREGRAFEL